MKENKYDNPAFFEKYREMPRSKMGLAAAGEWPALKKLFPDLRGKRMLDLGCGYGWHCRYAIEQGAASAVGVDISRKMLAVAQEKTKDCPQIEYRCKAMEEIDFPEESFDIIFSSLALHYVASFGKIAEKVERMLTLGGNFLFSVEHPTFTAYGTQDWYYDETGKILHFPVDHYYEEGKRIVNFLGEPVVKYHRTLTTYLESLLKNGFSIQHVVEPQPTQEMMETVPGMQDEMRRPMMLIISAVKSMK